MNQPNFMTHKLRSLSGDQTGRPCNIVTAAGFVPTRQHGSAGMNSHYDAWFSSSNGNNPGNV